MFADYSQWEQWRGVKVEEAIAPGATGIAVSPAAASSSASNGAMGTKKKLSYLEAREYAGIETAVEAAEDRLQTAREMIDDPAVAVDAGRLTAALAEMEAAQEAADGLYARWAELTEKVG
jgi:ABC transport system ATP-binding/permease protein